MTDGSMTDYMMVQFKLPAGRSTLADVAERLGVSESDFDANYGVVPTDPADNLFVAMVDSRQADAVAAKLGDVGTAAADPAEGMFSNPSIDTFGPPES